MSTIAIIGIVCGVGLVGLTILGILASMLLPALARAKGKANRVKCVNNCKQSYNAMLAFAQDNDECLPWQLKEDGVRSHVAVDIRPAQNYGEQPNATINEVTAHPNVLQTAGVWGLAAVKRELYTPKILHSPCDPDRVAQNDTVQMNWDMYDTKGSGVSIELGSGTSYTLIRGADTYRPSSVLLTTRNWSGKSLNSGEWLGADRDEGNARTMAGLAFSQGQLSLMDAFSRQSTNADLGDGGRLARQAEQATGGVARGQTSLRILRGAGLD